MIQSVTEEKLGLKELVAMGVGGMVGGGIFSVLGLAVGVAGHAAPIAFFFGAIIALLTGFSYAKLGLVFHSDGGSFTYLEHAFRHRNIAGIGGWLLVAGYIGTMALYAYTFAVYGTAMFGENTHSNALHHFLQSMILLIFLGINLYGIKAVGKSEDVIVMVKVFILSLFAIIGLFYVKTDHLLPFFNQGRAGVLMGAALIFVAYEGFELIPNAVREMKNPLRDLPRAIFISIVITTTIYILVALVAVGNLSPSDITRYKEYALAVAAKPFLGKAGFMLIALAALLSTASAINATLFGTARLAMVMAKDKDLPRVFTHKERLRDIPWVSLVFITAVTILFVNTGNLTIISAFASSTFLLIFASINLSAFRLRRRISIGTKIPLTGLVLTTASWMVLIVYLWQTSRQSLMWICIFYVSVITAELLFSQRKVLHKEKRN
ncbi:inner membrane transport protein YbaT [bacterium BMS3Abin10]|nr:inner membrane transport protein YbaT [bacterium BMS3Abin10]GBE39017.1 inner membrane transport protein YbaT [bacterium BMS3Bbin08]